MDALPFLTTKILQAFSLEKVDKHDRDAGNVNQLQEVYYTDEGFVQLKKN